jgi:Domain of unknown function (DUF5069)
MDFCLAYSNAARERSTLCLVAEVPLRSPLERWAAIFYFARMLDKIQAHADAELPPDYHANLGKGFDEQCVKFLRVEYDDLIKRVKRGGNDQDIWTGASQLVANHLSMMSHVWNELHAEPWLERRSFQNGGTQNSRSRHDRRSDIQTSFNLLTPMNGVCPNGKAPSSNTQVPNNFELPIWSLDIGIWDFPTGYSSNVSIRSARLKSSSVNPPLLCVESTRRTLL